MTGTTGDEVRDKGTRLAMLALFAVLVAVLVTVCLARMAGFRPDPRETAPVVASRELTFRDSGTGSVLIYDSRSGEALAELAPGEGSFIRGVMRSLTRERRSREHSATTPFHISRHRDGSLLLEDPATGRRIELQAFGPTNVAAFAALLDSTPAGS